MVRNFARKAVRGDRRRAAREAAVSSSSACLVPTADELLARHETQRVLAELVSSLKEPYRSTVLLRYVEDLEPAEIARREGIPAATVRWRLKQARDELGRKLYERFGDRHAWSASLARIAGAREADLWEGTLLVKTSSNLALGAAILAAVALGIGHLAATRATGELAASTPAVGRASQTRVAYSASDDGSPGHHRPPGPPRLLAATSLTSDSRSSPSLASESPRRSPRPPEVLPLDRRYDLTQNELLALASNCEVRLDIPGMKTKDDRFQGWMEQSDLDVLDLEPDKERPIVWAAMKRYRDKLTADFRGAYVVVTGDAEGARELDIMDFGNEDNPRTARFLRHMDARHFMDGARIVAEELAGLDPAPSRFEARLVSRAADLYRRQRALADEFEREVAAELGVERARQIRRGGAAGQTRRTWCP